MAVCVKGGGSTWLYELRWPFFIHVSLLAAREDHFSLKRMFSGSMSDLRVVPWDAPLSPYMAKGKVEGWRGSQSSNFYLAELKRSAQIFLTYQIPQRLSSRTLVALPIE